MVGSGLRMADGQVYIPTRKAVVTRCGWVAVCIHVIKEQMRTDVARYPNCGRNAQSCR
jgi:hypothetical protein